MGRRSKWVGREKERGEQIKKRTVNGWKERNGRNKQEIGQDMRMGEDGSKQMEIGKTGDLDLFNIYTGKCLKLKTPVSFHPHKEMD